MALQPPFALGYIGKDYLPLVRAAAWLKGIEGTIKSFQFVPAEMECGLMYQQGLCISKRRTVVPPKVMCLSLTRLAWFKSFTLNLRSCSDIPAEWEAEERGLRAGCAGQSSLDICCPQAWCLLGCPLAVWLKWSGCWRCLCFCWMVKGGNKRRKF